MTVYSEGLHTSEYLVSEANGYLSREVGTITGGVYEAGTILGRITASGHYTRLAPAATDGSEAAAAILYEGCDASTADQSRTITARASEVNGLALVWPAGITDQQKAAAIASLATKSIIVRD